MYNHQTNQFDPPVGKITPATTAAKDLVSLLKSAKPEDRQYLLNEIKAELETLSQSQLDKLLAVLRLCTSIAS